MDASTGLTYKLQEMAGRIRELRAIEGLTVAEMARKTGVTDAEYRACEAGASDLNFAFLYRCAQALRVDVTDIIEGASPKLNAYTVTRSGSGQRIEQAHGMVYYNLAPFFKKRIAEPLYVRAAYRPEAEDRPVELTTHAGQECDIVLRGTLRVQVGSHSETLYEGDSIYYDSATPHGMIAVGGQDCLFYAIVLNPTGERIAELEPPQGSLPTPAPAHIDREKRVCDAFVRPVEDERGALRSISFTNQDQFNFAFDIVDALGREKPDKLALLHLDREGRERRYTFRQMSRDSSRAANYFKSLGIRRGDRVMLVLRRQAQFWTAILGLHKLGAVAVPATDQLLRHDYVYRFNAAGVSAVVCTAFGGSAEEIDAALSECPSVRVRLLAGGSREGWRDFDEEFRMFSSSFPRTDASPRGDDPMLMYFTSGTTGYPKITQHSCTYPLGHYVTARYWQGVDPDGLHLTISDTGWAKAMWGKLYGQWLCEGAVFAYDFDRFDASKILPLFAKYRITSFCAPPTMYRFLIREDLSRYDLSSIRRATIAGEALNPEVYELFRRATGLSLMEGFGQTESTVIIGNLIGDTPRAGSMGRPSPLYDVELVDGDGQPVPVGETGEIVVRTAAGKPCGLFERYYQDDKRTGEVWHDGLYHTGDTAWRDEDGYYWYVGRVDDVIKSSGYRIGPFEIESVIMELPYVLECGVSPAPDPIRGQVVKASVVLTRGTEASEALAKEIQEYVKKHTAPYKYPRIVVFREDLPKTTSGKIMRARL